MSNLPQREEAEHPLLAEPFWWERDDLHYENGHLRFSGHDVAALAAKVDGPLYIYALDRAEANVDRLRAALALTGCPNRIYYAMKANRYGPLLRRLAKSGKCGIDACSPDEIDLALTSGFSPENISFTGTGVSNRDLDRLLAHPGLHINCDTVGMIRRIGERAPGRSIGLRVNPGLGIGYADNERLTYSGGQTTKFGIYAEQWPEALAMARTYGLTISTLHFHVGCGYLNGQLDRWEAAVAEALRFLADVPEIRTVNIGGGLGLPHRQGERPLDLNLWSTILRTHFSGRDITIAVEPGDYLVKDAGMLVLGVTDVEQKRDILFVHLAGGFNLHPEPAYYDLPCEPVACHVRTADRSRWSAVTLAGNINEALDIWAKNIVLPPVQEEDYIALLNAGGYGAAMHSNHCMRGSFTEIHVANGSAVDPAD